MTPTSVSHCEAQFHDRATRALLLATDARGFFLTDSNGALRRIPIPRAEAIGAMALLQITVAWEAFLEDTFARFLCGASASNGPTRLLVPPCRTIADARAALLGGKKYLRWDPDSALQLAQKLFQGGEPASTGVGSVRQVLLDANVVRNRFAHSSQYSRSRFSRLVLREFGVSSVPGLSPGRFLAAPVLGFAPLRMSYLELYAGSLQAAAMFLAK